MPPEPARYGSAVYGVARYASASAPPPPPAPSPTRPPRRRPPQAMNDPLQNRLNMIGACLALAHQPEHQPTWEDQPPLDLTTDMETLGTLHTAATALAATLAGPITGAADAKAEAETALEDAAFVLARALCAHFRKTGDLASCSQVDFSKSAIKRLRDQDLIATATTIKTLGTTASADPTAVNRGVTPARLTALTAALTAYTALVNKPRTMISDRAAQRQELETRVAACLAHLEEMDDLVLQLDTTAPGRHFINAWKNARVIVDAGHGPGEEEPPTPPTP